MPSSVSKLRQTTNASRHSRKSRSRNPPDLTRQGPSVHRKVILLTKTSKRPSDSSQDTLPQYDRFDMFDKDILNRRNLCRPYLANSLRSKYRPRRPTNDQLAAATAELDMEVLSCIKPSLRRLRIPLEKPPFSIRKSAAKQVRKVQPDNVEDLPHRPYPGVARSPDKEKLRNNKAQPAHCAPNPFVGETVPCTSAGRSTGIFFPFTAPGLGIPALPTSRHMDLDLRAAVVFTADTSTVQKIVSEILPPSSGLAFGKDARDLLIECCVEFITLISSEANEISEKEAKKTIACEHITKALEQLGFGEYVADILEVASEHKEQLKGREKKTKPFEGSGLSTDELLAMQEAAFREAAERHG